MNKKKFLTFGMLSLFALVFVSALTYYAVFTTTITVQESITLEGDIEQELGEVYAGEEIVGTPITISNDAPSERTITITDDSDDEVEVSYVSTLTLSQKVVDFSLDKWELLESGDTAVVEYVVVGDEFSAEVVSGDKTGYVLVYYKDNSDRFNSPATAIGVDSISGNLPYENDANADEYNYCATEEYVTCHGAKLWYVPEIAIDTEGNIDWSQASDFLFETKLIQFNSDGKIVLYSETELEITPVYVTSEYASGEKTITTTIA